jgi:ABC-type uncharacterized transport system auxiliary subunit
MITDKSLQVSCALMLTLAACQKEAISDDVFIPPQESSTK